MMVCYALTAVEISVKLSVLHITQFGSYRVELGVERICLVASVSAYAVNDHRQCSYLVCSCKLRSFYKCVYLFLCTKLEVFYPYIKMHVISVFYFSFISIVSGKTIMEFG